jgi:ArsR family transcriptional regulator, arsenate/arsenite/antimonite-responsive transcriptional repressor
LWKYRIILDFEDLVDYSLFVDLRMSAMSTECCSPELPADTPPLDEADFALLCKALGHPARVRLLKHLVEFGACYFGSLADVVGLAPSTTSQHVTVLKDAGLICGSSDEQRVCYCINPERLAQYRAMVAAL